MINNCKHTRLEIFNLGEHIACLECAAIWAPDMARKRNQRHMCITGVEPGERRIVPPLIQLAELDDK